MKLQQGKHKIGIEDLQYAMVTGASRGLGKELARELARLKYNLLLVSLKGEGLKEVGDEIKNETGVEVYYYEADLSQPEAVFKIAEWALSEFSICILVNNAGIGGSKAFGDASPEYIDNIIQINIRATSLLTRLLLHELKKHRQSYILNVASMASFSPIAYKTVYPASKTFIWSFSRGLNEELKDTGVFVCVIHPGPMKTNPDVTRRIEKQGFWGRMGLIAPDKMARIAIHHMMKHDALIIPGFPNKINWLLTKIVPIWIRLNFLSKMIRREINKECEILTYS
jgi:short-subunit dehydrogenase